MSTMSTNKITPDLLKQIMPTMPLARRRQYAPLIQASAIEFDITNEARVAAYLAQLAHESDGFNTLVEYASGAAYEGRRDLGNTQTGDGKRYKGRGAIQLTGRANYRTVGRALGLPLEDEPARAAEPENAFRVAGYYWKSHGLNQRADRREFRAISGIINAGSATAKRINGLADRVKYYDRALRALPDDFRLTMDAPAPDPDAVPDVSPSEVAEHVEASAGGALASASIGGTLPTLALGGVAPAAPAPVVAVQPVPIVSPDAPPVVVETTGVTKSGGNKSIIAVALGALSTLGVGVETVYGKLGELIKSGNPMSALIAVALIAACVIIYWKYQERQTTLDREREQHAHELTKLNMNIAADQTKNNVVLTPSAVPVVAAEGESALTPSGARE